MYSVSICDDDEKERDLLEGVLLNYFKQKNTMVKVTKFDNFSEMQRNPKMVDILFVDAEIIRYTDFCMLELFENIDLYAYVYILGEGHEYPNYINNMPTFRYIKKPVSLKQLYHSLDRIIDAQSNVGFMSNYLPVTLKENEIVCIYSNNRKTYVLTELGITYPTTSSIKEWQRKISGMKHFCQPHYSYIINRRFISSFCGDTIVLKYKNGQTMNVYPSQRRLGVFLNDYFASQKLL